MVQAGIPQPVAMAISGSKTDSVFRRYATVDERVISEGPKVVNIESARAREEKRRSCVTIGASAAARWPAKLLI